MQQAARRSRSFSSRTIRQSIGVGLVVWGLLFAAQAARAESETGAVLVADGPGYDQAVVTGFRTVAIASVADAVDKIAGRRGYLDSEIRPRRMGKAPRRRNSLPTPRFPISALPAFPSMRS